MKSPNVWVNWLQFVTMSARSPARRGEAYERSYGGSDALDGT